MSARATAGQQAETVKGRKQMYAEVRRLLNLFRYRWVLAIGFTIAFSLLATPSHSLNRNEVLMQLLDDMLSRYRPYLFYDVTSLGRRRELRERAADLIILIDPSFGNPQQGTDQYGRQFIGFNHLGLQSRVLEKSAWHEMFHVLIDETYGGERCGFEETYLENLEDRETWLSHLAGFEKSNYKKTWGNTNKQTCKEMLESWDALEHSWYAFRGHNYLNLSGPYSWQDPKPATCGIDDQIYKISSNFIQTWDAKLGIKIDIRDIKAIYQGKINQCRQLTCLRRGDPGYPGGMEQLCFGNLNMMSEKTRANLIRSCSKICGFNPNR